MGNSNREINMKSNPPLVYRVAKWIQKNNLRGGYFLENLSRTIGLLDVVVRFTLNSRIPIDVPISIRPYDFDDIRNYEDRSVQFIKKLCSDYSQEFILIDCGADIGLMSAKLLSECPAIRKSLPLNQIMIHGNTFPAT
jgi:hypothetical protein